MEKKKTLAVESENLYLVQVVPHTSCGITDMLLNLSIYETKCFSICLMGIMTISFLSLKDK